MPGALKGVAASKRSTLAGDPTAELSGLHWYNALALHAHRQVQQVVPPPRSPRRPARRLGLLDSSPGQVQHVSWS